MVLGGCHLPFEPGCGLDAHGPDDRAFLQLALLREHSHIASVAIDPEGRSDFVPAATAWMLRTGRVCKTLAAGDLLDLQTAWERAGPSPWRRGSRPPDRPALLITYSLGAAPREFVVRSGASDTTAAIEHAVELTLAVLARTYGERFVQEIRAAGLESLRP
jgi:hypothetical protein